MKFRFILFYLITLKQENAAFLNDAEQKIMAGLMEALSVGHTILLEEPTFKLKDLQIYKRQLFRRKATVYQNTQQILKYFWKKSFPAPRTLIILKVKKFQTLITFFKTITRRKKSHLVAKFSWLIFIDSKNFNEKDEKELLVPLDSEFIVTYPVNSTSYKLTEIYRIKSATATFDFGVWHEGKLVITDIPWYRRRRNFQNETLVMTGLTDYGDLGQCKFPRHCAYLVYLETLSAALNFSLEWRKFSSLTDMMLQKNELDIYDFPYDVFHHSEFAQNYIDTTNRIFQNSLNWYIRDPTKDKSADYYIRPFETQIWIYILNIIIITGLTALFVNYLLRIATKENDEEFDAANHLFMPFYSFCNQEGAVPGDRISPRILCFFIRFLALFVFGSYSAIITSFSSVHILRIPFRNAQEFLKNGKYKLFVYGLYEDLFFENTSSPIGRALREKIVIVYDESEISEKAKALCEENYAFPFFENDIEILLTYTPVPCGLYQIEHPLLTTWMVTAVQKNSPFRKMIDHFLIDFYSSGIRQRTYLTFTKSAFTKKEVTHFDDVTFEQISQILIIFGIGALISTVFVFLAEIFCQRLKLKMNGSKKK